MFVNHFRIHFINGQMVNVAECATDQDDMSCNLIERFMEALPDGVLMVGTEDEPQAYIPANKILYISQIPEAFL